MTHLHLEGTIIQLVVFFFHFYFAEKNILILRGEICMQNFKLIRLLKITLLGGGNWITLKMRKLMKSKKGVNRGRQKSLTLTPTRSDSSEGFLQLPHQDSQDSSSVGSNSLEDGQTLGTKKSSSECLNSLNICDL